MDYLKHLPPLPSRDRAVQAAVLTGTSTLALSALIWCIRDYHAFLALGPGGVPYNLGGWAFVTMIRLFALSKRGATQVSDYPIDGAHEDIKSLPNRKGERAAVGGIIPHRQLSQYPPDEMKPYITNLFKNIVVQNSDLLEERLSLYEKHNPALFLREEVLANKDPAAPRPPQTAYTSRGECGHVHPDYSLHLYLSPADARLVIEKGWAERHRLAKPKTANFNFEKAFVASTYLMIYGPRDTDEVEVVRKILQNSIRFMSGREDVEAPEWKVALAP
ncbi:uncharacterized protein Z520_03709 [Fonsecaea multimorphosa CBS 102226]|uniref:Luciferase domain-containing protein n=1 Tax=Fonsecaea multimorphosa CBS 102226 TaxID=1442371 RepID=A0A0D2K5G3_9EURO|nr:uncharacterized protein Z520_03709 [Fonsecaea multimorphosa CBS 102226]KIY01043.1 hypothetical protein Z520_03709 [Fonsecaea multimorphosa CBS 102226]OAL21301.1 hypothetical protein AYO22_08024 [Fonsecaea multimorphosa]